MGVPIPPIHTCLNRFDLVNFLHISAGLGASGTKTSHTHRWYLLKRPFGHLGRHTVFEVVVSRCQFRPFPDPSRVLLHP